MAFKRYLCWQTDQVHRVMNPDAEHIDDDVFLAVHSEHPLWLVGSRSQSSLESETGKRWSVEPTQFLGDFLSPAQRHVQVAVIGDSGAGKSHLIHWMQLKIPPDDDRYVLSIPRTGTTLRGVLDRVIGILPPEDQRKYRERLDQAGYYSEDHRQRKRRLLSEISLAIGGDHPRDQGTDPAVEDWVMQGLRTLFQDPYVVDQCFMAQDAITDQLVTHIVEAPHEYRHIAERQSFTKADLPLTSVDLAKMSSVTAEFFGSFLGMPEYQDLAIRVVNRNLNTAIGRMLNFTGDQLLQLLMDVRRFLKSQGKSLILLIEDLVRLQGIDGALLQALIEPGDTDPDGMCELRWAAAVTTGYYERLEDTVKTRMSMVVDMNVSVGEDAAIQQSDIIAFAARYLNAVRLPRSALEQWYGERAAEGIDVPNGCVNCSHREICDASFGQVQGIGLYPFNRQAIVNMARFRGATEPKFNPRRLIKYVFAEVLDAHGAELSEGMFPSGTLRSKMLSQGQGLPPADVERLRRGDLEQYERQQTVLELWGAVGKLSRLPDGLYEAFDLRPPRLDGVVAPDENAKLEPQPVSPQVSSVMERRVQAIKAWANNEPLKEETGRYLQELVFDAVIGHIDWDGAGLERRRFAAPTGSAAFGKAHIWFARQEGRSVASTRTVALQIPSSDDTAHLMQAALALEGLVRLKEQGNWEFENGELCLVALAERLEEWSADLITQFQRLPDGQGAWDPVGTATEILVVGATLGGCFSTTQPSEADLMNALFEDWPEEAHAQSSEWKELYRQIHEKRPFLTDILRTWASGTKGGQAGGYVDAWRIVSHASRLMKNWAFSACPPASVAQQRTDYGALAVLHARVEKLLPVAAHAEHAAKMQWLAEVEQFMPGGLQKDVLVEELQQTRIAAVTMGLGLKPPVLYQYDTTRTAFAAIDLESAVQSLTTLHGATDFLPLIPLMGREATLQAIRDTRAFFRASKQLVDEVDRLVQSEVRQLNLGDQDVSTVQANIRKHLKQLDQVLGALGEEYAG